MFQIENKNDFLHSFSSKHIILLTIFETNHDV
jgi:hypothetical protein